MPLQDANPTPSFGGFGVSRGCAEVADYHTPLTPGCSPCTVRTSAPAVQSNEPLMADKDRVTVPFAFGV